MCNFISAALRLLRFATIPKFSKEINFTTNFYIENPLFFFTAEFFINCQFYKYTPIL